MFLVMCARVHLTLKQLSASIGQLISSVSLCSSRSSFTREAPFRCAFPASASQKCIPTQGAGRRTNNSFYKEKKGGQSKTQLLHPEGHLETSNGLPSFWSGCRGTVDTLHGAGTQQTRMPRHALV